MNEMTTAGFFGPIPSDLAELIDNAIANSSETEDAQEIAKRLALQVTAKQTKWIVGRGLGELVNERRRRQTREVLNIKPSAAAEKLASLRASKFNAVGSTTNAGVAAQAMVRDYLSEVFVRGVPLGMCTRADLLDAANKLVAQARGELRNAGIFRALAERIPDGQTARQALTNNDIAEIHEQAVPEAA